MSNEKHQCFIKGPVTVYPAESEPHTDPRKVTNEETSGIDVLPEHDELMKAMQGLSCVFRVVLDYGPVKMVVGDNRTWVIQDSQPPFPRPITQIDFLEIQGKEQEAKTIKTQEM